VSASSSSRFTVHPTARRTSALSAGGSSSRLRQAAAISPGEDICHERNKTRPDRQYGPHVVRNHMVSLRRNIRRLDKEGFRYVHELRSVEEIDGVGIARERLWTDARHECGPFDIIGDVHGCADELEALLAKLGYPVSWYDGDNDFGRACTVVPPAGRRAIFVGDLVDRGPRTPDVLRLVYAMAASGAAFWSTATRRSSMRSGSTTRFASTPAAFSAASSRPCAGRRKSWSRSPLRKSTRSRSGPWEAPPMASASSMPTTMCSTCRW
jgi:hypothetical protein